MTLHEDERMGLPDNRERDEVASLLDSDKNRSTSGRKSSSDSPEVVEMNSSPEKVVEINDSSFIVLDDADEIEVLPPAQQQSNLNSLGLPRPVPSALPISNPSHTPTGSTTKRTAFPDMSLPKPVSSSRTLPQFPNTPSSANFSLPPPVRSSLPPSVGSTLPPLVGSLLPSLVGSSLPPYVRPSLHPPVGSSLPSPVPNARGFSVLPMSSLSAALPLTSGTSDNFPIVYFKSGAVKLIFMLTTTSP